MSEGGCTFQEGVVAGNRKCLEVTFVFSSHA